MDTRLLKILEEETAKEKAKKKKKPIFKVRKEKSITYYSGWHKGKPLETKEEKQLTELFGKSKSVSEISKLTGRQSGGIRSRLRKLGLIKD